MATPVLAAENVTMRFRVRGRRGSHRWLTAVEGVDLDVHPGEVVAIVGESGSGKSTVARVLSQLYRQSSGRVLLDGQPASTKGQRAFRRFCKQVQLIFQDPFASLNPLRTIRYHLVDPLKIHDRAGSDVGAAAAALLERVKLTPPERYLDKYPHELSGGQRQRVSIARALAADPRVLLADEPVSMLDVSIRLGILNLLGELKSESDLGIVYITHDIASARHFADRVLVMYAAQIVESGPAEQLTQDPKHPYTMLLIGSAPDPDRDERGEVARDALSRPADPPSLISPPSGCRFHPRCPLATEKCSHEQPPKIAIAIDRWAACWAYSNEPSDLPLPSLPDASVAR